MGNVVGFVVLLALSTAAALLMDNIVGSMPLYLLVFLLFASLGYVLCVQRRFRCTSGDGRRVIPHGVPADVTAHMRNDGRLPLLHLRARVQTGKETARMDLSLAPREAKDLHFTVTLPHVGPYEIGVPRVRFYDPLGLFSLTRRLPAERVLAVPRIYDLSLPKRISAPLKETVVSAFFARTAEPESYTGVREYRPGDSLRHIHWKLTAHTARYMSRRYETRRREGVTVYIDRLRPEYADETCRLLYDCVTEAGLSLAAEALRRGLATEVVSAGPVGFARRAVRGEADLGVQAAELGGRVFGGHAAMADLLASERKSREGNPTLCVCAAYLSPALVQSLAALAESGWWPMLVCAVPDAARLTEEETRMLAYLARRGIPAGAVDTAARLGDLPGADR